MMSQAGDLNAEWREVLRRVDQAEFREECNFTDALRFAAAADAIAALPPDAPLRDINLAAYRAIAGSAAAAAARHGALADLLRTDANALHAKRKLVETETK